ncbi:MAG: VTT domain-containing protein [Pseudomonadota bacterium]
MNTWPVIWIVALTLFLGGLGLPLPENPILVGGGYTIHQKLVFPVSGIALWFLSILSGDFFLYAAVHWFFRRRPLSNLMKRWAGEHRLERYQQAFASWGGWTLFMARFTFGIRGAAYIAAGAVGYPWMRFLIVDGLSVGIQVLLFVGIGYFAGDRIEWAKATSEKIIILLTLAAVLTLLLTWGCSFIMRRASNRRVR